MSGATPDSKNPVPAATSEGKQREQLRIDPEHLDSNQGSRLTTPSPVSSISLRRKAPTPLSFSIEPVPLESPFSSAGLTGYSSFLVGFNFCHYLVKLPELDLFANSYELLAK